jgi:propionyl-CoA carboxylase alpha chain
MTGAPIRKILIANRGEIAVRIMRTCKDLGIATVGVFSDADRRMPHVLMADEAYRIGPAPSKESYLLGDRIIETALKAGADAIHPGYGFLSEKADFARQVSNAGLVFIGPPHTSIAMMGDKTEARKRMIAANVPVVPGTTDPIEDPGMIAEFGREHGFPLLIKAAAGGGGKGMRIVHREGDIPSLFRTAQSEALSSFGDGRVFVEKYLSRPRHIEFQILADRYGSIVHLGERECSIQRRHQKLIEESPSVIVDPGLREKMGEAAVSAARACGYANAGTVEFLVDDQKRFYFLEVNTRLQVEHPVTELRAGLDLVAEQIRIASGEKLGYTQADIRMNGHAIECRICAEDPTENHLPSTGTITHLRPSEGPGVRDDRGVDEGGEISVYYDPLISKLIVLGKDRDEALRRMTRALQEYEILGVTTNIALHQAILVHPKFRQGEFDTHFLSENPGILKPADLGMEEEVSLLGLSALLAHRNDTAIRIRDSEKRNHGQDGWKQMRQDGMRGA